MGKKGKNSDKEDRKFNFDGSDEEDQNFSDEDGFVDDITDEELLGDLLAEKPKESDGVESVIIVDQLPVVEEARLTKLKQVINKLFSGFGNIVSTYYPQVDQEIEDDKGKRTVKMTKGYVFIEYDNPKSALEALNKNSHKLDKQHTLLVNLFTDFEKFANIPDEWEPPKKVEYKERPHLHHWLLEPDAFDQYSVLNQHNQCQVWLNSLPQPTLLQEKERWSDMYMVWSPLGTYLATFHIQGVQLWGGKNLERIEKFNQPGVHFIDFSPNEEYLVCFSPRVDSPSQQHLVMYDIRTGAKERSFSVEQHSMWPVFRWSKDDKYFAKIEPDKLSVYQTPSFGLLQNKSLTINGIKDFDWSPTDNILAYWVEEDKNTPARVVLLEIPSRRELRTNNLFNVADCKIHWQKSGDYLCVKVDRYSKVKKEKGEVKYSSMYYNFEIFHMREKNIPVDSVEIKEPTHAFAWEPVGDKFAVIHGEPSNTSVSFYGVKTGQAPTLLRRLERKSANHLFWSPMGTHIVLAELRDTGSLEFVDTGDFSVMNAAEHHQATDVEWDPTGRYVMSGVSLWKTKADTGYWQWSFQGKIIKRFNSPTFCQLRWRPRPASLLSKEEVDKIKKSLKKYTPAFEAKDRQRMNKASKELIEKRRKLFKQFEELREKLRETWEAEKEERKYLRNLVDTDELDSENVEEEVVEFVIKEEITICE
ncbi:hypothetical protein M8J76_008431 [Diaphorina citri]|nr:hypothetical protein M8J76_008431 [Diaphorina citri]KAI5728071.1 hypothetical protein M8J77_011087 [Diaphorina citri]